MAKDDAAKVAAHNLKVRDESVKEFYEQQANLQPTPTQEENDRAKLGAPIDDDKEDDGSEWEDEGIARVMTAKLPSNNPYMTRAVDTETVAERPARRRGRPRRGE